MEHLYYNNYYRPSYIYFCCHHAELVFHLLLLSRRNLRNLVKQGYKLGKPMCAIQFNQLGP